MRKLFNVRVIFFRQCWLWLSIAVLIALQKHFNWTRSSATPMPSWLPFYLLLLFLLITLLCVFTSSILTLNRTKKGMAVLNLFCNLYFVLTGFLFYNLVKIPSQYAGWFLLGITLCFLTGSVITIIRTPRNSYDYLQMNKHKSRVLWGAALLALAFLGSTFWIPGMWGIYWPVLQLGGDLLGYYGGQLSLTFITISVMSVLSDKSVIIYWENIAEARLIKPLFGCFASYTTYSITATVGAGISVILNNGLAFAVFFCINILVLILLTLTMVNVYFGREEKKRTLEQHLKQATHFRNSADCSFKFDLHPQKKEQLLANTEAYNDIMFRLQYHLHREIDEHNIPYIREVAELYGRNMHCFRHSEGQTVERLLFSSSADILPVLITALDSTTTDIEQQQTPFRSSIEKTWQQDVLLWNTFMNSPHLKNMTDNAPVLKQLTAVVFRRFNLLLNNLIILDNKQSRTYRSRPILYDYRFDAVALRSVLDATDTALWRKDGLLFSLLHLIQFLLESGDPLMRFRFKQHPAILVLTEHLKQFDFSEDEIALWKHVWAEKD